MFTNNFIYIERPWAIVVLIFSLIFIFTIPKMSKSKVRFNFDRELLPKKFGYVNVVLYVSKFVLICSFIFLSFSWIGISKEVRKNELRREAQNIILLLDISPSMSVEDIDQKSRWQASKDVLESIINSNQNSKLAIIVFSNTIAYIVPFTKDLDYIKDEVNSIYLGDLGEDTALADALAFSYNIYTNSIKKDPTKIVVLTDGYQNNGLLSLEEVSPFISSISEDIIFIQFGTSSESSFTYNDRQNRKIITGTIKPSDENLIYDFLNSLNLQYFNYENEGILPEIISSLYRDISTQIKIQERSIQKIDLSPLFIKISIVLLLVYLLMHHILLKALW